MKMIWYLLTLILGVVGLLALLRFVENIFAGGGISLIQLLVGIVCVVGARKCLAQARRA